MATNRQLVDDLSKSPSTAAIAHDDFNRDEELRNRVRLFLAAISQPGLRALDINVLGATVVLRGVVRTFYEKQLASQLSQRVAGVMRVIDQIVVQGYPPSVALPPVRSGNRDS